MPVQDHTRYGTLVVFACWSDSRNWRHLHTSAPRLASTGGSIPTEDETFSNVLGVSVYGADGVPYERTPPNRSDLRPEARPSRMPRGEAQTVRIAIIILLALSEKFQEGADERMARAVLVGETREPRSRDRRAAGRGLRLL